ncbi:MAG: N-acetylmuramoyl-L-alanine amidase, partial [Gammaproteobacteria bacterium]
VSVFRGRAGCNDFSIGIELEGCDDIPYTDAQYSVLESISRVLMRAYPGIIPARIVGHSDIAPGRKTDPGPAFDWPRLRGALA